MSCSVYLDASQRRWDGEAVDEHDLRDHLTQCPICREWAEAVRRFDDRLALGQQEPPAAERTTRIVNAVLFDRRARHRRQFRLVLGAAVAAGILLALLVRSAWLPTQSGVRDLPQQTVIEQPAPEQPRFSGPPLRDSLAEAGAAVAVLTRQTANDTRLLLPRAPETPLSNTDVFQKTLGPTTTSLREAGQAVSDGLQPVTVSARRAFDLFLRELPIVDSAQKEGL